MTVNTVDFIEMLTLKLGKEEAKMIVSYFEENVEKQIDQRASVLATKDDIRLLREDFHALERRMFEQFRWLVGIILTSLALAVTIIKFL